VAGEDSPAIGLWPGDALLSPFVSSRAFLDAGTARQGVFSRVTLRASPLPAKCVNHVPEHL